MGCGGMGIQAKCIYLSYHAFSLYVGAGLGHLELFKWLQSQEPPCPYPGGDFAANLAGWTAERGHFHVLEWIIRSRPCSMLQVALHAARTNCSKAFQLLTLHHCFENMPMNIQLAYAAGRGSLQTVKHLIPYLQKHDSSNAMFTALSMAMHRTRTDQMTQPVVLEVIKSLWSQFHCFWHDQQQELSTPFAYRNSRLLVEPAACNCGPFIPWTSAAYSTAVCKGSKKLLWWLLYECNSDDSKEVPLHCSPGRTLLLVHGHEWIVPSRPQWYRDQSLANAERLFLTFYCAAHRLSLLQCLSANPGSLPHVLLKKIACSTDIGVSWTSAII